MARKADPSKRKAPPSPSAPPAARHLRPRQGRRRASWRCSPNSRSRTSGLPRSPAAPALKLSQLRAEFGSVLAIFAAHVKDIDRAVLAGGDADMAEEPPRERLFDVLMRRLEALAPYKEAVRSVMRSARRDPPLALALNAMAVRSQQWMLEAAGISATGPRGMMRAQGAALMFARVLRTWVDDDDEATTAPWPRSTAGSARGQRWVGLLDDLCRSRAACILRGAAPAAPPRCATKSDDANAA